MHYDLTGEGLDIPSVSLGDLPDFLSQGNTTLRLANPQLYVGVESNPVAEYGLNFGPAPTISCCRPPIPSHIPISSPRT